MYAARKTAQYMVISSFMFLSPRHAVEAPEKYTYCIYLFLAKMIYTFFEPVVAQTNVKYFLSWFFIRRNATPVVYDMLAQKTKVAGNQSQNHIERKERPAKKISM